GHKVVWSNHEFSFHTCHPGEGGVGNYVGPHDGRVMSTIALDALASRRALPLVESPAIAAIRRSPSISVEDALAKLIDKTDLIAWRTDRLARPDSSASLTEGLLPTSKKGFRFARENDFVVALLFVPDIVDNADCRRPIFEGSGIADVLDQIDRSTSAPLAILMRVMTTIEGCFRFVQLAWRYRHRIPGRLKQLVRSRNGQN